MSDGLGYHFMGISPRRTIDLSVFVYVVVITLLWEHTAHVVCFRCVFTWVRLYEYEYTRTQRHFIGCKFVAQKQLSNRPCNFRFSYFYFMLLATKIDVNCEVVVDFVD